DANPYLFDVGADPLGDLGKFVHETDLGGQHRVGGILGQLGGTDIHDHQAVVLTRVGLVQCPHQLGGTRVVGADDDAVGAHEVLQRRTFLEKFRIGHHVEFNRGA